MDLKQLSETVKNVCKRWWIVLILGLLVTGIGVYMIANRGSGFVFGSIMLVVEFISVGITTIIGSIAYRKVMPHWILALIMGILLLGCGIAAWRFPDALGRTLIFVYAFGFMMQGVQGVSAAFALKKQGLPGFLVTFIMGVLTIVVAVGLLANPVVAVLTIDILISVAMLFYGIMLIFLSSSMESLNKMNK